MENDRCGGLFNAGDFGLKGGGQVETATIQKTVDACSAAGGGTVYIPPGRYLSGTIFLKDNVNFHLSAGAVLAGSPSREDYNADDVFPENGVFDESVSGAHLVIAYCRENVSITGQGRIDGNSSAFLDLKKDGKEPVYRFCEPSLDAVKGWRPGQMVFFCRCRNVTVRDVSLVNAPYWTLFLHGCTDVNISGLTILNPPDTPNGDGIDIDCCRSVAVSDCIIRSGDDCITLRGGSKRLGKHSQPCEDVVINNCVLSTPCNAFRVGVGDGQIRRCEISNIVVKDARVGVNIISRYSSASEHGARIEHVHFSDFAIDACIPLVVQAGYKALRPAAIRHVTFSGIHSEASAGSLISGSPEVPVENIRFSDCEFVVRGGTDNCLFQENLPEESSNDIRSSGIHGFGGSPALPCVLYGVRMEDSVFDGIRIYWDRPSKVWREGLLFRKAAGLSLRKLVMRQPGETGKCAVRCVECAGVEVSGCRAEEGANVFLHMEQSASEQPLYSSGNNFSAAKEALKTDIPVQEAGSIYGK